MKTIKILTLSLLLSCGFFISNTTAQIDVTVNPVGLLFGGINVGADFTITENISIEPTIGLGFRKSDELTSEVKSTNIPVSVFGKYYFNPNHGSDKFYASVFLRFVSRSSKYSDDSLGLSNYSQTRFGAGVGIGYKIVSKNGIVFDIGFGAGRAFVNNTKFEIEGSDDVTVDWPELMIVGKLGIGYRFGG